MANYLELTTYFAKVKKFLNIKGNLKLQVKADMESPGEFIQPQDGPPCVRIKKEFVNLQPEYWKQLIIHECMGYQVRDLRAKVERFNMPESQKNIIHSGIEDCIDRAEKVIYHRLKWLDKTEKGG